MKIGKLNLILALGIVGAATAPRAHAQSWSTQWEEKFQNGLNYGVAQLTEDAPTGDTALVSASTLASQQNDPAAWGGASNQVLKVWLNAGQSVYNNPRYKARAEIQRYKVAFNADWPRSIRCYSFDVLIPKTWPADPDTNNIIIAQLHPNVGYDGWAPNPALMFTLNPTPVSGDAGRVKLTISSIIPGYSDPTITTFQDSNHLKRGIEHYSETASRGVWQRFWVYVKWSPFSEGQIEVRRGYSSSNAASAGTRLFLYNGATTGNMFPQNDETSLGKKGGANFAKWGLYVGEVPANYGSKAQKTIYFDNFSITLPEDQITRVPK